MKIKYVGLKDEETAFSRDTGITWQPGASHEVADAMAKRMLQHPDVFAVDEEEVKPAPKAVTKTAAPAATAGDPAAPLSTDGAPDTSGLTLAPGAAIGAAPAKKPEGEFVIKKAGEWLVLDDMSLEALKALAESLDVKVSPQAKEPSIRKKLVDLQPKDGW